MRVKHFLAFFMAIFFAGTLSSSLLAEDSDSRDILREGLVGTAASTVNSGTELINTGATTSAISTEATTAGSVATEPVTAGTVSAAVQPEIKRSERWKGALEGAGLKVENETTFVDTLSGEKIANVRQIEQMTAMEAYADGYMQGYRNGYKAGYTEGYKDGIKDASGKKE